MELFKYISITIIIIILILLSIALILWIIYIIFMAYHDITEYQKYIIEKKVKKRLEK